MERRLITTDCHIAAPIAAFDDLPDAYRQHFASIETRADGKYHVASADMSMMGMGRPPEVKLDSRDSEARLAVGACDEAHPSFEPSEVVADLERDGVYGGVLIGRIATHQSIPVEADVAYCKVVNDWMAEHWGRYLDRFAPGILLPYRSVAESVKELERGAALGLRPALLPDAYGELPYHRIEWEPLWEAASALKMPITMHVGGARNVPNPLAVSEPYKGMAFVGWYDQCVLMGETLGWLTFSGVFERYPDLHVVMTEGYAGWLAFAIQFFDHHWSDSRFGSKSRLNANPGWTAELEAPPSYYLKRQAHATFMWDPMAIQNREITGTDALLWGNDYPHVEGSFPFSQEWNDKQFAGVPEPDVDAMVRGNAAKLFNINIG